MTISVLKLTEKGKDTSKATAHTCTATPFSMTEYAVCCIRTEGTIRRDSYTCYNNYCYRRGVKVTSIVFTGTLYEWASSIYRDIDNDCSIYSAGCMGEAKVITRNN